MFRRVYFDNYGSKIHLWETSVDGKKTHEIIDHPIVYYTPDHTNNSDIKDIYGNQYVEQSAYGKAKIKMLIESGIKCCETDLDERMKFLNKRYLNQNIKPNINNFKICNLDIEVQSEGTFPDEVRALFPINLITIKFKNDHNIYTFGINPYEEFGFIKESYKKAYGVYPIINYCCCENENTLLRCFFKFFKKCDPDIVSGWNCWYDIKYIIHRLANLDLDLNFSPIGKFYENPTNGDISIAGLIVLDYMEMYKEWSGEKLAQYSLDFVSRYELGEGKMELDGTINTAYKINWNKFVEYNMLDVVLVDRLDEKLKLVFLAISFAYQALIPIDKTVATMPIITGYILKFLHKNNMVLNDRENLNKSEYEGAYISVVPGIRKNLMSHDIESEYPSVLRQFNISPETLVVSPEDPTDLIRTPMPNVYYKREPGVLPQIVKTLFLERKALKRRGKILKNKLNGESIESLSKKFKTTVEDINNELLIVEKDGGTVDYYDAQQNIRKIIVNSVYGVLGNPYFHFYNPINAEAVTLGGQSLIKFLSSSINKFFENGVYTHPFFIDIIDKNYKIKDPVVVLIHTDSCYTCIDEIARLCKVKINDNKTLLDFALGLNEYFFEPFFEKILQEYADSYEIEQLINFKHEKILTNQIILKKNRYVSEYIYDEGIIYKEPQIKYTGIEIISSSTPPFCRKELQPVVNMMLHGECRSKVISEIFDKKKKFKESNVTDLSYSKGTKEDVINNYPSNSEDGTIKFFKKAPPHVKAYQSYNHVIQQLKLQLEPAQPGNKIRYVYIKPNALVGKCVAMGFVGNWPKEFNDIFEVDYATQFEKSFTNPLGEFFEILGWGEIPTTLTLMSSAIVMD